MIKTSFPVIEGAVELKYCDQNKPLFKLLRSSQVVSFVDYYNAGGRKRMVMKYCREEQKIYFYSTHAVINSLTGDRPSASIELGKIQPEDKLGYILHYLKEMMK